NIPPQVVGPAAAGADILAHEAMNSRPVAQVVIPAQVRGQHGGTILHAVPLAARGRRRFEADRAAGLTGVEKLHLRLEPKIADAARIAGPAKIEVRVVVSRHDLHFAETIALRWRQARL